ncbi:hypothetical protein Tco_0719317 [Tanacetum coccineum]
MTHLTSSLLHRQDSHQEPSLRVLLILLWIRYDTKVLLGTTQLNKYTDKGRVTQNLGTRTVRKGEPPQCPLAPHQKPTGILMARN